MLVHCVGCDFEGYVDDHEYQLCHGCRHDPSEVARAKAISERPNIEDDDRLGNDIWGEYLSMLKS